MGQRKPFKSVDDQVAILKARGVDFTGHEDEAATFLLRENYYSVVNGHKDMFLDKAASSSAGEDRYREGTHFFEFKLAHMFDEALRRCSSHYLYKAENVFKTAVVYAFCESYRQKDAYLDPSCYCGKVASKKDDYTRSLIRLLSTLQNIRENRVRKPYIEHYAKKYGEVPLWVAAKCLTFGNISAFFDLQTQSVKQKTCSNIMKATGVSNTSEVALSKSVHTLTDFRNICAHSERLYKPAAGKNGSKTVSDMLLALEKVLPREDVDELRSEINDMIDLVGGDGDLKNRILTEMSLNRD